jgi:hypothetical protein
MVLIESISTATESGMKNAPWQEDAQPGMGKWHARQVRMVAEGAQCGKF